MKKKSTPEFDAATARIYLSVDLDAFFCPSSYRVFKDICTVAVKKRVPTKIVESHEALVAHANGSNARLLWNLDAHSDVQESAFPCTSMHCGNWINFIKWKSEGQAVWVHPFSDAGEACALGSCAGNPRDSDFWHVAGWGHKGRMRQLDTLRIPWHRVDRMGIAISPEYIHSHLLVKAFQSTGLPGIEEWACEHVFLPGEKYLEVADVHRWGVWENYEGCRKMLGLENASHRYSQERPFG